MFLVLHHRVFTFTHGSTQQQAFPAAADNRLPISDSSVALVAASGGFCLMSSDSSGALMVFQGADGLPRLMVFQARWVFLSSDSLPGH